MAAPPRKDSVHSARESLDVNALSSQLIEDGIVCAAIYNDVMRTLSHCFICGHVHDELIIECDPRVSLKTVCEQMGRTPSCLPGIELRADGYECLFYKKE